MCQTCFNNAYKGFFVLKSDEKNWWEYERSIHLNRQPYIKEDIINAMSKNPQSLWCNLEKQIGFWYCKTTIRKWDNFKKGYKTYNEQIIPLLNLSPRRKLLDFSKHYVKNWGLGPGKYLLINYDEKWFWGMVTRLSAKSCSAIGLDPVSYKVYHNPHINKVMCVNVTGI